ncbi:MAG: 2-oxoacid:acceptor oxidoreductase subunit alpha [Candidatus Bathyarchaeia archaeon]
MSQSQIPRGLDYLQGNEALVEGAIAAGCRFFAGYPITPSNEISERMSWRLPQVGGIFVQGEDELASIAMVIGASWGGLKAMTATSGPGFSLMQEGIGYACITETPCVIVDIQRCAPGQGIATKGQQGDMMQARWGTHGDHEIIALAPASVQEMFDLAVEAFNLSESYRVPCLIMAEEIVAHMRDKVRIRDPSELCLKDRKRPDIPPGKFIDFHQLDDDAGIPPMPRFGDGYRIAVSAFSRNRMGYPITDKELHGKLLRRLSNKILKNIDAIARFETAFLDDADVIVVSYGTPARSAKSAVKAAREEGIKAGYVRLITVWPFHHERLRALCGRAKEVITVEMNLGQIVGEVKKAVACNARTSLVSSPGVEPPTPWEILSRIREVV